MTRVANAPLRVESFEVLSIRLRFRRSFAHHQREHRESRPTIVRLRMSDGIVGYGESLPRVYVTGETEQSVSYRLNEVLCPALLEQAFPDLESVRDWVQSKEMRQARQNSPAAFCGLELALLDAVSRSTRRPLSELLGPVSRNTLIYDGAVVGFLPRSVLPFYLGRLRDFEKKLVKIKVGREEDAARLQQVRRVLGPDVALVLDANGAWSHAEAITRIKDLERFDLAAVEQPVTGVDFEGLAAVSRAVDVPIVADESICTLVDAQQLLDLEACAVWNLRVGKCGGLLATLELAELAASRGIECRMGVLVGESGLLGAAGRLLAASVSGFRHLEFDESGNRIDDVLREPLAPIKGNRVAVAPEALGLGVTVDEDRLSQLTVVSNSGDPLVESRPPAPRRSSAVNELP